MSLMKTRDTCARIGPLPKSSVATFKPGFVLDSNRLGRARYTRKNGLFNINSYIVQLIMLLIPCVCLSNTLPREKAINLITTGDVNYYFKDTSAITVERLAAEFGSVPPWQKIWLCDYLKKRLGNWDHRASRGQAAACAQLSGGYDSRKAQSGLRTHFPFRKCGFNRVCAQRYRVAVLGCAITSRR